MKSVLIGVILKGIFLLAGNEIYTVIVLNVCVPAQGRELVVRLVGAGGMRRNKN